MNDHFEGAFRWEFCKGACFILWWKRSSGFIPRQFHFPNFLDSPQRGISTPSIHEMFFPLFKLYFLSLKGDTPTLQGVILFHVVFICVDSHTDSLCIQVVKLQLPQFPRGFVLCQCFSRWNRGSPGSQRNLDVKYLQTNVFPHGRGQANRTLPENEASLELPIKKELESDLM